MAAEAVERRVAAHLGAAIPRIPRGSPRTHSLTRRDLLTLTAGLMTPTGAWAQAGKTYRLGVLVNAHNLALDAFLDRAPGRGVGAAVLSSVGCLFRLPLLAD